MFSIYARYRSEKPPHVTSGDATEQSASVAAAETRDFVEEIRDVINGRGWDVLGSGIGSEDRDCDGVAAVVAWRWAGRRIPAAMDGGGGVALLSVVVFSMRGCSLHPPVQQHSCKGTKT